MSKAKDLLISVTEILFLTDPYNTGCVENEIYDEYLQEATLITANLISSTNIATPGEIAREVFMKKFGYLCNEFDALETLLNTELEMF